MKDRALCALSSLPGLILPVARSPAMNCWAIVWVPKRGTSCLGSLFRPPGLPCRYSGAARDNPLPGGPSMAIMRLNRSSAYGAKGSEAISPPAPLVTSFQGDRAIDVCDVAD